MGYVEELQRFLESEVQEINVVVMPDFFLDRLISLKCDVKNFYRMLGEVAKRNGGSIDGIEQVDLKGGNAVNAASALAALDVKVTPIVCTSKLGLKLIRFHLKSCKVDLFHVKIFDNASITTAIELENEKGKVNVMLRDVGALADFGPQHLDNEDFEVIENVDYVCVFNWAGTRHFGTELAETVFRRVKTAGKGKTYNVIEVLKYFPKEDVWLLGGLSPTALVHDKGKLVDENGEEIELEKKPVKPHKTDYESERDYKQARQEYKEQKETWGASELLYTSKQNEEGGRMKMTDLPAEIIIEKRKMQAEGKDVKYLIVTSQTHIELLEILKQQSKFFPRHIHATRLKEFKDLTIIEVENLLYQKFMLGYRPSTRLSLK